MNKINILSIYYQLIYYQYTILIYYTTKKPITGSAPDPSEMEISVWAKNGETSHWATSKSSIFSYGDFPFSNQKYGFFMVFMGIFPLKKTNQTWGKMGYSSIKMDSHPRLAEDGNWCGWMFNFPETSMICLWKKNGDSSQICYSYLMLFIVHILVMLDPKTTSKEYHHWRFFFLHFSSIWGSMKTISQLRVYSSQ